MPKKWFLMAFVFGSLAFAGVPDQIYALGESERRTIFARLLASESSHCTSVSRTFYQGRDAGGAAYWSVQCSGIAYQVMISDNAGGSSRAVSCDVLKAVGSRCFVPFK